MDSIKSFLIRGTLLMKRKPTSKIKIKATRFHMIHDLLYRHGFHASYLRFLASYEADYDLVEIHKGVYGNHSRARSLAHKVVGQGHYWSTMLKDAVKQVSNCDKCQKYSLVPKKPTE